MAVSSTSMKVASMTAEAMSQGLTPAVTSAERSGEAVAVTAIGGERLLGSGDAMLPFDASGQYGASLSGYRVLRTDTEVHLPRGCGGGGWGESSLEFAGGVYRSPTHVAIKLLHGWGTRPGRERGF